MSRKVLGLFVMGLMLFSLVVVLSVKLVVVVDSDSVLKIVIYFLSGVLFMGVWNLSFLGYSDIYFRRIVDFVFDSGIFYGIDGVLYLYYCYVVDYKFDVIVLEDVVIFNLIMDIWVVVYVGEIVKIYVRIECDRLYFYDGYKFSVVDVMYSFVWSWEWIIQDGDDDLYYDVSEVDWSGEYMNIIFGIKFVEQIDDRMVFDVYYNYYFLVSEIMIVVYVVLFIGIFWQFWYVMSEFVVYNFKYFWSEFSEDVEQFDQINLSYVQVIKEKFFEFKQSKLIFEFFKLYIEDENVVIVVYDLIVKFIDEYNYVVIGQGLYYVDEYQLENFFVRIKKFDKWIILVFVELEYQVDLYYKIIEVYGIQNEDIVIFEVVNGYYDIFWYLFVVYRFIGLSDEQRVNIKFYRSILVFGDIVWNLVYDQDNLYVIIVGDKKYFNLFVVRKVRFVIQYFVNRVYIIQNIFQGSVGLMFILWILIEIGFEYVRLVVDVFGFIEQFDEDFVMKLFEEGMQEVVQEFVKMGYEFKKGDDGKWYFNGELVKVVGFGCVEDERKDVVIYIVEEVFKKFGFDVEVKIVDRRIVSGMVYISDLSFYQWNFYIEGWVFLSNVKFLMIRIIQYYLSYWYVLGFVGWKWILENIQRVIFEEVFKFFGNGDIQVGFDSFGFSYYNIVDKIQLFFNWIVDDFVFVIYFGEVNGVKMDSEDKYWDFNRFGIVIGIYEGYRIFFYENWEFYVVSKDIEIKFVDLVVGFVFDWVIRSVCFVGEIKIEIQIMIIIFEIEIFIQIIFEIEIQIIMIEISEEGGGICGLVFFVGFVVVLFFFRRRR